MNILFLTHLYPGYPNQPRMEATYALHSFCKEWQQMGHNVLVLRQWDHFPFPFSLFPKGKYNEHFANMEIFTIDGVRIIRFPVLRFPKSIVPIAKQKNILTSIEEILEKLSFWPDIIIKHGLVNWFITPSLKRILKVPLVLGLHNSDIKTIESKKNYQFINKTINMTNLFAFRSPRILEKFRSLEPGIISNNNNILALSGIEERLILPSKVSFDKKTVKIVTACYLIPRKNVDTILKAVAMLENKNIEVIIIGDGPQKGTLKKLADNLAIAKRTTFLGNQPRDIVIRTMRSADIFIMASSNETFGLVYLEAMASGCITVGSKGEGIDGVIQNKINGFLVGPQNARELSNILKYIIQLPLKEQQKIINNSIITTKQNTSKERALIYIRKVEDLFKNYYKAKE